METHSNKECVKSIRNKMKERKNENINVKNMKVNEFRRNRRIQLIFLSDTREKPEAKDV